LAEGTERPMEPESALKRMVRIHMAGRGIRSRHVLGAFLRVDRRHFVPDRSAAQAYDDHPLVIGDGQTISQPFMVALMLEALEVRRGMKVLEVGAGSGYVLALLTAMGARAFGVEWHGSLAAAIPEALQRAGWTGPRVRAGDGGLGWPEEAPFDRILVSAACPRVPPPLLDQLDPGGVLVAPVDAGGVQVLTRIVKRSWGLEEERGEGCVFVPLLGRYGKW